MGREGGRKGEGRREIRIRGSRQKGEEEKSREGKERREERRGGGRREVGCGVEMTEVRQTP